MQVVIHQFDDVTNMTVLPLAAGQLAAAIRPLPGVEPIIEVLRRPVAEVVSDYDAPDILAFSCYVWNLRYTLEVVRRASERFPEAMVVLGGPSVPRVRPALDVFLANHPGVDVLVLGEGEFTFRELVEGRPLDQIPGVAFRSPDGVQMTRPRERIANFTELASPYQDGTFDALMARHGSKITAAAVETNRGCPFACTFCDWGQATRTRVRELPMERVRAELDWVAARGFGFLYLVDANFGIRKRDVEIARHIAAIKTATGFPQYCMFHMTKNAHERNLETVEVIRSAGVHCQVALSMQDFDSDVLAAVKRKNISLDESLALRKKCNERGIPTFNELLLGLPRQTYASFAESVVKALTPFEGDTFYLYLVRLLENTELASEESRRKFGIETRVCQSPGPHRSVPAYVDEVEEVIVGTASLPPEEWRRSFDFGFLVSALCNLRVLDLVTRHLRYALGINLVGYFEALLDGFRRETDPASAGHALVDVLERYGKAVEQGLSLRLPLEGTGDHLWDVDGALALTAIAHHERFYAEVARHTQEHLTAEAPEADTGRILELIELQALLTPRLGATDVQRRFAHDWISTLNAARAGEHLPPTQDEIHVVVRPPPSARATSFEQLAAVHLMASYSRQDYRGMMVGRT